MSQPIIRGIQAVGAVDILYRFNHEEGGKFILNIPDNFHLADGADSIDTTSGLQICGFRLDSEFLRATQQIDSSQVIPVLGGGGVALTNNNRTGSMSINCTKVSTPDESWAMLRGQGFGPTDVSVVAYDLTTIAQIQQAQPGGDAEGATIAVCYRFCGQTTIYQFDGCTIARVDPVGLAGNDAVNYNVTINYLNWEPYFNQQTSQIMS